MDCFAHTKKPTSLLRVFLDNFFSEREAEKGEINAVFSLQQLENAGCLRTGRLKINIKDTELFNTCIILIFLLWIYQKREKKWQKELLLAFSSWL